MQKKTYEFEGWKYEHNIESGYNILPQPSCSKPSSFFKYYALSQNSVDALTHLYIYATHPRQFNDPFDCNEKLVKYSSWNDIRHLCDNRSLLYQIQQLYPTEQEACKWAQSAHWLLLYKKMGLVSLTTKDDNYQMWAHYAQNNGFCLEFDIEKFPFLKHGPFPIHYVEAFPEPLSIGEYGGHLTMLVQTNIKNIWWCKENEWRLLIPNPMGLDMKCFGNEHEMKEYNFGDEHDRKFRYPLAALKSITLGPKFFDQLYLSKISENEIDIICHPDNSLLEYAVLFFLAKITEKNSLNVRMATLAAFDHFNFSTVQITQYGIGKFRITNIQE